MRTMVRVAEDVRKEPSIEKRLGFVEDEPVKMRLTFAEMTNTLGKLAERTHDGLRVDRLVRRAVTHPRSRSVLGHLNQRHKGLGRKRILELVV